MAFLKSIAITILIFLVVLWTGMTDNSLLSAPRSAKIPSAANNHALIIGISNYDNLSKLESPAKDAEAMAKVLSGSYNFKKSNITLLTDNTKEKPTLAGILTALETYKSKLTAKDNLVIFFSGHSEEDDDGNTYWITKEGKKKIKMTWLAHTALNDAYFASKDFKVRNLCIITDSPFSNKLIRSRAISLSPFDLRYPEKISERATRKSREVLSFGDKHWPGDEKTNGLGLFTYYITKAMAENELEIIDFENLIFDENVYEPITKIAGTKMVRGRIRTKIDKRGQFIIAKVLPASIADIVDSIVSPNKGYPGDIFKFNVKTSEPADEVYLEIEGKKHLLKGADKEWELSTKIDKPGNIKYKISAVNRNNITGKTATGQVNIIKKRAEAIAVLGVLVNPKKGMSGDKYNFTVTTDNPATKVAVLINKKRYNMKGSDKKWSLSQIIDEIGTINFSVIASNEDGVEGDAKDGTISITAGIANVLSAKSTPKTGFAGEEFKLSAETDRPAKSVSVEIDGSVYPMGGSGKNWSLKTKIPDIGKKKFTISAINQDGIKGKAKIGELTAKKSPLPIPDVTSAVVTLMGPGKGYPGDKYKINVNTSAPSHKVAIDIEGKKYDMKGSGTTWSYIAKIDKLGTSNFSVMARNKDGAQGQSKEGNILIKKKPAALVNVITAEVNPKKGTTGRKFSFKANTDRPAKKVTLLLDKKRYDMKGSKTKWSLTTAIATSGTIDYSIIALNENNVRGSIKTASVTVVKKRFKKNKDGTIQDLLSGKKRNRFIDNGNGTITDIYTSLMWLQQPKRIATTYDEAIDFCTSFKQAGLSGWRLPTISELNRIKDKKQQNPSLPTNHLFNNVITHIQYWSKTKHKKFGTHMYSMNLYSGKRGQLKKKDNGMVWPVRYTEIKD